MDSNKKNGVLKVPETDAKNLEDVADRKEILCEGYFYDVTDFIKKHPGGNIIYYYTQSGEDSTHAIQQFHHRSIKKVRAMMKSFKKRPAMDSEIGLDPSVQKKNRALTEDFTKLYLELEKEGLFKPSYRHVIYRVIEFLIMGAFGYALLQQQHYFAKFVGIVLLGLTQGRMGWIQHEAGHYSFTGNPKYDRVVHALVFGLGLGLSSTYWSRQHNRHHAMPQRLHYDVDLNTMPLLAFNAKVLKNTKEAKGFLIQNQVYLFALIDTFLVGFLWLVYLHPKYVFRYKYYLQIFAMAGHWLFFIQIGFWPSIISSWIVSIYLFVNFTLNHTFLPITTEPTHWVEYSLLHTADVEQKPWCDWWMGYLNYQIEHHLFPTMPQFRNPLIKHRVRALAAKHNIPYIVNSYFQALRNTFQNLTDVANDF